MAKLRVNCTTPLEEVIGIPCRMEECTSIISTLILAATLGPVGRKFISKTLGIGEKKARRIIDELRLRGLVRVSRAGAEVSIEGFYCLARSDRTISLVSCPKQAAQEKLGRIVELRDRIVILLADPKPLEVIAYVDSGTVEIPFLNGELKAKYASLIAPLGKLEGCTGGCLVAVFSAGNCYRCCASFLQALTASG
jgi:hypothetical protein